MKLISGIDVMNMLASGESLELLIVYMSEGESK